jgi:hypothetical protein
MARKPQPEFAAPIHKTLSRPTVYLMRMLVFLALVGFMAAILSPMLMVAFKTNPLLNGFIIGVLFFGIMFAFRQVLRLFPEIKWINAFRIADPGLASGPQPTLLAPMATMLRERKGTLSLSTTAMRTIMDSIGTRLDEARDTGRYLIGLLVFLGLLGTFWGLLETIQSVGATIAALDTKATDASVVFDDLKTGLSAPLKGMGTAFSASLIGLSGSLVMGFLELQASHAHNRFYNELEEWLSGITELTPAAAGTDAASRQLYGALLEVQRDMRAITDKIGVGGAAAAGVPRDDTLRELAGGVGQLVNQMRQEQQVLRQWVDDQAVQNQEVAALLKELSARLGSKRS